ncbi:MAG: tRNA (N6-threonylcarbamoyladenosine(37)-N6)-methyltransferase TrmO [Pseudomonadota bacterium]
MTSDPPEKPPRPGEVRAEMPPATDAGLRFIGRLETPWKTRADCPKNLGQARERGGAATLHLAPPYRAALAGLAVGDAVLILTWMDGADRDLVVQAPRHRTEPAGTFALRSPARPNPIGLGTVRITALDAAAGRVGLDASDCLDGTPVIDLKPWIGRVDIPPGA